MRPLRLIAAILAPLAFATPAAEAGFYTASPIDGPSADIVAVTDLDLARDGQGAVAYLRKDGGVARAFVSRYSGGRFQAPQRLDGGLDTASSQVVVGAADSGRLAAAYVSNGTLYATVFDPATGSWGPVQGIAAGASNPSLDLSIHGAGFLTFTLGGDVRAARLERTGSQFTLIGAVLDLDPAQTAGEGSGRSRVAIGADSTAVAVWGENGKVVARRLYRTSISAAPADLGLGEVEGRSGLAADLPDVSIEDDSSFAQVVFRQSFADAGGPQARAVARRLRGSAVDAGVIVDGSSWGGPGAVAVDTDLNGRGDGGAATLLGDGTAVGAVLKDNKFSGGVGLGSSLGSGPAARIASSETTQRVASWFAPQDASVRSRFYDDRQDSRAVPAPGPEAIVSAPDLGPVDPSGGLEASANRVGDFMTAFVQGTGDARTLVFAAYDRAPVAFALYTSSAWRNPSRTPLTWAPSTELNGGATYIVQVDGREVGRTTQTSFTIPPAALVTDGVRTWRVIAVDQRGQQTSTPARSLRLDSVAPAATIQITKGKRSYVATVKVSDVLPPSGRASGVATVTLELGGGTATPTRKLRIPRGKKKRTVTVVADVTDKAGNAAQVTRRVVVPKLPKGGR